MQLPIGLRSPRAVHSRTPLAQSSTAVPLPVRRPWHEAAAQTTAATTQHAPCKVGTLCTHEFESSHRLPTLNHARIGPGFVFGTVSIPTHLRSKAVLLCLRHQGRVCDFNPLSLQWVTAGVCVQRVTAGLAADYSTHCCCCCCC